MIAPYQKPRNSGLNICSVASAVGHPWTGSYVLVLGACLSLLLGIESAQAVDIPLLSVVQPEIAATHPELVTQRAALTKERKTLLDRTNRHNASCETVEVGSAADASCTKAYTSLEMAINNHVQASQRYNANYLAAVNLAAQTKPAPPLPLSDSSVVDARNVPSGLSKSVEHAIATAYANAPPGVSERVRKGFQAVADGDWKVAKALFEDALKRDPGNSNLKRLVALVDPLPDSDVQGTSPRQGAAPLKGRTTTPLNAAATTMSTEQSMLELEDFLTREYVLDRHRATSGGVQEPRQ
ncbi:MAG: hypothetical protein E8D49_10390 [Nitrospira sp.]|nr:MAG: hypothetical protein E8D49_10390 [Nitrospira sp.]